MPKTAKDARLHPELWEKIKAKWHEGSKGGEPGRWNARKAQLAVQEYKRESRARYGDGGYKGKKARGNSLVKWTKEDWGYVVPPRKGERGDSRYLPKAVREKLTEKERRAEHAAKRGKRGRHVAYSAAVAKKMRAAKVF